MINNDVETIHLGDSVHKGQCTRTGLTRVGRLVISQVGGDPASLCDTHAQVGGWVEIHLYILELATVDNFHFSLGLAAL